MPLPLLVSSHFFLSLQNGCCSLGFPIQLLEEGSINSPLLGKLFHAKSFQQPVCGLGAFRKLDPVPLSKEETGAGCLAQQRSYKQRLAECNGRDD